MPQRTRLAVVMDPIEDIKYAKDTTLAMLLAAQARGHELWYLRQGDLYLRDGLADGIGSEPPPPSGRGWPLGGAVLVAGAPAPGGVGGGSAGAASNLLVAAGRRTCRRATRTWGSLPTTI